MKKLLAAITFAAGAVFGMLFSTKRGAEIRKEFKSKATPEGKAEVVGEEAKDMLKDFWQTIKGPLKKGYKQVEWGVKKYGKKYGSEALEKLEGWEKKAAHEIKRDVAIAKKGVKKTAARAKKAAVKKFGQVRRKFRK